MFLSKLTSGVNFAEIRAAAMGDEMPVDTHQVLSAPNLVEYALQDASNGLVRLVILPSDADYVRSAQTSQRRPSSDLIAFPISGG